MNKKIHQKVGICDWSFFLTSIVLPGCGQIIFQEVQMSSWGI